MITIENFEDSKFSFSTTLPPNTSPSGVSVYFPTEELDKYTWMVLGPSLIQKLILRRIGSVGGYLLEFGDRSTLLPIEEIRDKEIFKSRIQTLIRETLLSK